VLRITDTGRAALAEDRLGGRSSETASNGLGLRSACDLAREYGLPHEALRKRLRRWRKRNDGGWIEVRDSERRSNQPKFLYRPEAVAEVVDAMKKAKSK